MLDEYAKANSISPTSSPTSPFADVRIPHASFADADRQWTRIRDVLAGTDAVKRNASYLPTLAEHKERRDLADAYTARANFVGFAARTVDALVGAIFRKEGGIKVPRMYKPRLDNFDNRGSQIYNFAKKVTREVISYGRIGLLTDIGQRTGSPQGPLDFLPYTVTYGAQSIINWRERVIRGVPVLDQVILLEGYTEPRYFGSIPRIQYRVLELDDDGFYRVRIIRFRNEKWSLADEAYPEHADGRKLDHIPFVFIGPTDLSPEISPSPIIELVDSNLEHYRSSAELAAGRHYSSSPTPVVMGVPEDQQPEYRAMTIGAGNVWLMPPSVTDVRFLEPTGDGLPSLERALMDSERHMAMLGARLLEAPKLAAEAAETVRLRNLGETSTLGSIARTVADGMRKAMEIGARWAGIVADEGKFEFELNQDFVDATLDPTMIGELVRTYQAGLIPIEDLFWNLQRGEILRPGSTVESYRDALDTEGPQFARPAPAPAPIEDDEEETEEDDQ
jgi:hypothetical protein